MTRTRNNEKKKRDPKRNHEADAAGSRSSKKEKRRRRRRKVVRWRLSQELLDYIRTREVMGFLAAEMPRQLRPNMTADLFDPQLREDIAAEFVENKEFDAYVLYQYRTKGYAEVQEEEEDRRWCSQETSRVVREWFPAGIDADPRDINRLSYLQEEAMLNEWLEPGIMGDGSRSPSSLVSWATATRAPLHAAPRAVTQLRRVQ
ncbi:hypothetical protein BS78_10G004000 [Paspalum vaginatum]|nr:hypothetical protein BS78_10G004000 [Paspalum vaginatum]